MADRPDAYVRKDPGDIIRSGDWNELQIRAREELRNHQHTGGGDGALILGTGIATDADLSIKTLATSGNTTVNGDLKVNGKVILDGVDDLLARFKAMQSDTVNFAKDVRIGGSLDVKGPLIRKVQIATGLGPTEGTVNGPFKTRVLAFTKLYAETAIRIAYCDILYNNSYSNGHYARWEIRIDGNPAPNHPIVLDQYQNPSVSQLGLPTTLLGYARGIGAGTHVIGIWSGVFPGHSAFHLYVGWPGGQSRWTLEAEEVWL